MLQVRMQLAKGPALSIPPMGPVHEFWETEKRQSRLRPTGKAMEGVYALGALTLWLHR